ncbi:MAG: hypothetical protein JXA99_06905 [Candidatus Lokiarchaeota archaeon]|nr:hypothetical protein [Candidatus Lokiarchaeota archaeon]
MNEIKKIIDDIGILAFESSIKIASLAVISNLGEIIYQTDNWELSSYTNILLDVLKGTDKFIFNNLEFLVVKTDSKGVISTNNKGMGHIIIANFDGGMLVSFAMPQADTQQVLEFLIKNTGNLNGKI